MFKGDTKYCKINGKVRFFTAVTADFVVDVIRMVSGSGYSYTESPLITVFRYPSLKYRIQYVTKIKLMFILCLNGYIFLFIFFFKFCGFYQKINNTENVRI